MEYWKAHETAMANALERCSDDQELFMEIAKEMSNDVVPEQVCVSFVSQNAVCFYFFIFVKRHV